jgi:CubicO group peptidase (beta-lactamase class C family)
MMLLLMVGTTALECASQATAKDVDKDSGKDSGKDKIAIQKQPAIAATAKTGTSKQFARDLLPAGPERVLAEVEQFKSARNKGPTQAIAWQARRLYLKQIPITGKPVKSMEQFEKDFSNLMRDGNAPGAAIAIAYKGRLVYARGFGYADLNAKIEMQPDTLFRVASISKAFTSVGILKLCESGKISLDTKPIPMLNLSFVNLPNPDIKLKEITVRQLLQATAGWDRQTSGDPMFVPILREATTAYTNTLRPCRDAVLLHWLRRNLDFLPGTHFAYSNFGYAILGRLIEIKTGKPYEKYIQTEVLAPLGITDARCGKTLELAAGEATYYPFPGQETAVSVFPNCRGPVPLPWGGDFALEAMESDSGWIASVIDLVKFVSTMGGDGPTARPINSKYFSEMTAKPKVPEWNKSHQYFAMGWEVDDSKGADKIELSRQGSLAGSMSYVAHTPDGYTYAMAINTRPEHNAAFQTDALKLIKKTLAQKPKWADEDYYAVYQARH